MSKQLTAEQIAVISQVVDSTQRIIADLETAIETDRYKGRYVILMNGSTIAACKRLGANRYNFSAMGVDAATFTEREAESLARHFDCNREERFSTVPVFVFYQDALSSAKTSLAYYKEHFPPAAFDGPA